MKYNDLYVPSESPDFGSEWKQVVESTVNETFCSLTADENTCVPSETILESNTDITERKGGK